MKENLCVYLSFKGSLVTTFSSTWDKIGIIIQWSNGGRRRWKKEGKIWTWKWNNVNILSIFRFLAFMHIHFLFTGPTTRQASIKLGLWSIQHLNNAWSFELRHPNFLQVGYKQNPNLYDQWQWCLPPSTSIKESNFWAEKWCDRIKS